MQWIFILLAIIGVELCVKNALAFPKVAHALFIIVEGLVEFVGFPARKPFKHVVSRYAAFHLWKRIHAVNMKSEKVHFISGAQWFRLGSSVGRAED